MHPKRKTAGRENERNVSAESLLQGGSKEGPALRVYAQDLAGMAFDDAGIHHPGDGFLARRIALPIDHHHLGRRPVDHRHGRMI